MSISDFAETTPKEVETPWASTKQTATSTVEETPVVVQPSTDANSASSSTETSPAQSQEQSPPPTTAPATTNTIMQGIMAKLAPIGQKANFKLMIYSEPGAGKSSMLATAPDNFIFDLEDGLMSAKNSPHGIANNVMAYPWGGFEDFGQVVGSFMNHASELDPFTVVSIDSFSELHKRTLAEVMEREWQKRPSMNKYVPETEHYTEVNERMVRVLRALRDMDRNLIIAAHSQTVEPKGKAAKTYADFSEKLSNKVMAMMDVVGYIEKRVIDGSVVPVMVTSSGNGVHCKSRIPMREEIVNPTYEVVRKCWEESKNL